MTSTFAAFMQNDLTTSAAAISYFSILALFPTLILLLAVGNKLIGPEAVEKYVVGHLLAMLPGTHSFVRNNLQSITAVSTGVLVSCFFAALWALSWLFTVLEKALNRIWGTYPRSFFHGRAVNLAVMTGAWLLLAASALFTATASGLRALTETFPVSSVPFVALLSGYAWNSLFILASLVLTVLLFTVLFKWLPNTSVPFMEAMPGAALAGILWEAAKFAFAYLLPYFHYELLYGSIGAAIAFLTWVYMSSSILLFGAQFTALLHREHLFKASVAAGESGSDEPAKGRGSEIRRHELAN